MHIYIYTYIDCLAICSSSNWHIIFRVENFWNCVKCKPVNRLNLSTISFAMHESFPLASWLTCWQSNGRKYLRLCHLNRHSIYLFCQLLLILLHSRKTQNQQKYEEPQRQQKRQQMQWVYGLRVRVLSTEKENLHIYVCVCVSMWVRMIADEIFQLHLVLQGFENTQLC